MIAAISATLLTVGSFRRFARAKGGYHDDTIRPIGVIPATPINVGSFRRFRARPTVVAYRVAAGQFTRSAPPRPPRSSWVRFVDFERAPCRPGWGVTAI